MTNDNPKVTVGLPVYNGERFVADAIADVLGQTYADLELVISDNASTDGTQAICERFAAQDPRVRYVRHEVNRGAGWNFNEAFRLARGDYFKWLAADDGMHPEFLSHAVRILDQRPDVTLVHPHTSIVDEDGAVIDEHREHLRTTSADVTARFDDLVNAWSMCFAIFGLIRSSSLRQTGLMGNFGHGDGVLLAQLGMLGPFAEIDEPMHRSRRHAAQSMRQFGSSTVGGNDYHRYTVWFNPSTSGRVIFPHWRIFWELYRTIWMFPAAASDRLKSHWTMLIWLRHHGRQMAGDLVVAARTIAARRPRRLGGRALGGQPSGRG